MYSWGLPVTGTFDLRCLIGVKVDPKDIEVEGEFMKNISASLFLTTKRDRFAKGILGIALEGTKIKGFLDHY